MNQNIKKKKEILDLQRKIQEKNNLRIKNTVIHIERDISEDSIGLPQSGKFSLEQIHEVAIAMKTIIKTMHDSEQTNTNSNTSENS